MLVPNEHYTILPLGEKQTKINVLKLLHISECLKWLNCCLNTVIIVYLTLNGIDALYHQCNAASVIWYNLAFT